MQLNDPNYMTGDFNDNKVLLNMIETYSLQSTLSEKESRQEINFDYDASKRLKNIQLLKNKIKFMGRKKLIAEGYVKLDNSKS